MRKAARRISALYDEALQPFGINVAQYSLLRLTERRQPASLTELAREAELERSTMGRNIQVLQKLGLVEAEKGEDQREAAIRLSARGKSLIDEAQPVWADCQRRVEERAGPEAVRGLELLLERL